MKMFRTVAAVGLTAGIAAGGFGAAAGAAAGPAAVAERAVAPVGQDIRVQGSGWGPDTSQVVSVVLCGNAALDGAADCDLGDTAEGGIRQDGTFSALFTVPAPPVPCPCLLRVFTPATTAEVKIPLTVTGAPSAPPQQQIFTRRAVQVDGVRLEGASWLSWFGAPARRTLVYRVTNTGDVALHDPPVDVTSGRGASPDGFVSAPAVGDLAVNAARTFRVPVRFPALSYGTYRAVVRIDPFGTAATARATTRLTPWGLVGVAIGMPALALLRLRTSRRPARAGHIAAPAARPVAVPATTPIAVPVAFPAPGWYRDPLSDAALRLWDGRAWTPATRTGDAGAPVIPEVRHSGGPLTLVLEDAP